MKIKIANKIFEIHTDSNTLTITSQDGAANFDSNELKNHLLKLPFLREDGDNIRICYQEKYPNLVDVLNGLETTYKADAERAAKNILIIEHIKKFNPAIYKKETIIQQCDEVLEMYDIEIKHEIKTYHDGIGRAMYVLGNTFIDHIENENDKVLAHNYILNKLRNLK